MLLQRIPKGIRRRVNAVTATLLAAAVLLSTIAVLSLVSFAQGAEQMIIVSSDESSTANAIIPIADSSLSGDQYFRLTFKARMATGEKPIVGALKVGKSGSKYKYLEKPDYVDNEDAGASPSDTATAPDLYCKYNASTMEYTAVIMMNASTKLPAGAGAERQNVFGAITIGNTEYGTTSGSNIATADVSTEFVFAKPELKRMEYTGGSWQVTGENLLPSLLAENIDFSKKYTESFTNLSLSEVTSGDTLLSAPTGKFSTANNTLLAMADYVESLSTGHSYIYHELVEPTTEAEGSLPYYTCNCGDCEGKRFAKKGDQSSLIEDHGTLVIAKAEPQMIVVNQTKKISNAFIPLHIRSTVQNLANPTVVTGGQSSYTVYAKVTFKARMFSGSMPVLGVVSADGSALKGAVMNEDNQNDGMASGTPDLYCLYNPETLSYEAVIKFDVNSSTKGADMALTIGNAEHDGSGTDTADYQTSFAFCEPQMILLDPTTGLAVEGSENILPEVNSYNTKFTDGDLNPIVYKEGSDLIGAPSRDWGRDGAENTVEAASIPETFFAATHHFVEVEKVPATETKTGTRAYYYCDCGKTDCCFTDGEGLDKYLDKGWKEAKSEVDLTLPKLQMIKVGAGSNNVFVPLNLSPYVESKHKIGSAVYVQLTLTARMIEGKKPIVSRVRGSSDKGGDYSFSEPNYADNTNEEGGIDPGTGKPRLYTKYDEQTCKFTAVIQLEVGQKYSTLSNGVHDAILIGNAEHNGSGYSSESNSDVSFAFCEPELYLLDVSTGEADTSTGNLLPEISDETLNFSTAYKHNNNPCKLDNHILNAPEGMWSIDGDASAVTAEEIPDQFFKYYPFVFHKQVNPTKTQKGSKAYYTCECGNSDCIYAGKKFEDKGYTEYAEEDLVLSYSQMIKVGAGANNNVFVPLNLKPYAQSRHKSGSAVYVQLSFTARMLSGEKPVVSRVRGSTDLGGNYSFSEPDYANNTNEEGGIDPDTGKPRLYAKYDEDTCKYTAVIQLGIGNSWSTLPNGVHDAILIGNAEHNGTGYSSETDSTVSFAFCDPELYLIDLTTGEVDDSTGNLMPAICDETLNFGTEYKHNANPCKLSNHILSAPKNKWSIDGSKDNIEAKGIPDDYFKPYKFVLHEEVRPTSTSTGTKAYYTCECSDPNCMYKGKKYSDKGMTEVTDADLHLSKSKMITVAGGNNSNVYVPLDLKPYVKSQHKSGSAVFVQLSFTARMIEGKKPIVSRVRGSSDKVDGNGNPIQGSWSEPYYTDNSNEVPGTNAQGRPILYSKYDETTCKYTAVIELWVGTSYSTLANGVHDAILIGHAEHNGLGFQENDSTVAFSFCDPELYLIDLTTGQADTSTGNLMPAICDENLNFGKVYKHNTDNPCHISNHLLSAPKDKWSIDGSAADARAETIPANYFKPYKFVLHPEVRPTTTTTGTRAYYTCECSDPDCMYKGKKYSDKGTTEVTDEDLFLGKTKMITIDGYNYTNVFVPLDLKPYVSTKHKYSSAVYVQLSFTAQMLNGSKPIVSRVRGSSDKKDANGNPIQGSWSEPDYTDNNNETGGTNAQGRPILYTKYDETTCKFTAVIELWVGASYSTLANGVHDAILIGHAEHNGPGYKENDPSVSFSFCDPELYLIDLTTGKVDTSTGNLMPAICDENLSLEKGYSHNNNPCSLSNHLLSAPKDKWSVDGSISNVHVEEIPENYFRPLYGAYTTGTTGRVATDVSLEPDTQYVLRFGSKYFDDEKIAKPLVELKTDAGTVTEIGDFSQNVGKRYNTVYTFKTPANLSEGVNATVGVNIDSPDAQGVFSNFELYKVESNTEVGKNLISDPTLSGAGAGDADTIWKAEGVTYKPITIYHFKMSDPKMLIFSGRNGADTHVGSDGKVEYGKNLNGYLENLATIENGKQYLFSMNYKMAGTGYSPEKQDLADEVGPKILVNKADGGFTEITEGKTENPDECKLTYLFTAEGLSETKNNFKFHFDVIGGCTSGYLANVVLYEYNGQKAVGDQLLKNGDFSTGDTSGWTLSSSGHFYHLLVQDIPENFFTKEGAKPNMIVFRNSTDYYRYDQHVMIKPNTRYQLEYQLKISATRNEEAKPAMAFYVDIFNKKDDGSYIYRADGINVSSTNIPLPKDCKEKAYQNGALNKGGNYTLRFKTNDELRTTGDGNTYVRLYTMEGSAGYWGKIALYELDEKGNKIGNNIVLNGDFTSGLACWMPAGQTTDRVVQQPNDSFFSKAEDAVPKTMVYSNGSSTNQTYGNIFKLDPDKKYYFSGTYVNMNAAGLEPQILYATAKGKYKKLETQLFYDPSRYFFEIEFEIPEDAYVENGKVSVKAQISNNKKGKGYFTNLSLTEEGYFINLFDKVGFISSGTNYKKTTYKKSVFVFYYDDTAFDDGNWSGEAVLTAPSSAQGRVVDQDGNPLAGIQMLLSPGYSAVTGSDGNYSFDEVKPGTYTLYLIDPATGARVFCTDITIEEAKAVLFPDITYIETEEELDLEMEEEEIEVRDRAVLQGLVFNEKGKRLTGVPIYVEDNGYKVTNEKGIFTFNNLTNLGKKKIYMYLEDGSKYVFRYVNLKAGKGLRVKLRYRTRTKGGDNWIGENLVLFILLCVGAAVILAGGVTLLILLLKKKKKKKVKAE